MFDSTVLLIIYSSASLRAVFVNHDDPESARWIGIITSLFAVFFALVFSMLMIMYQLDLPFIDVRPIGYTKILIGLLIFVIGLDILAAFDKVCFGKDSEK